MRCLAKDPDRRFASATELRRALQAGLVAERARREGTAAQPAAAGAGAAAADVAKPAAKPAAAARERRVVALLFFESKSNVAAIRDGGQRRRRAARAHGGRAVRAGVRARGRRQPDARRRQRRRDVHRPRAGEGGAGRPGVGFGAGAPRRDRAATRARCSARRNSIRAKPIPRRVAVAGRGRGVARCAQRGGREPARVHAAAEGRAGVGADDDADGRRAAGRARRAAAHADRSGARHGPAARGRRSRRLWASPGTARRTWRRCWCSTSRCCRACRRSSSAPRRCWVAWVSRRRASCCSARCRCPTRRPRISAARCWRRSWASRRAPEVWAGVAVAMAWAPPEHPELRSLAAAPGALRSAAARALGEALRRSSRAQPLALVIEDAHFVDETALDAIEYATLVEAGCPIWVCVVGRPAFGRGRTAWASRAAKHQQITLPPLVHGGGDRAGAAAALPGRKRSAERARPPGRSHARRPDAARRAGARPQARRAGAQVREGTGLVSRHRRAGTPARPSPGAVAVEPGDGVAAARSAGARAAGFGAGRRVQQRRDRGRAAGAGTQRRRRRRLSWTRASACGG